MRYLRTNQIIEANHIAAEEEAWDEQPKAGKEIMALLEHSRLNDKCEKEMNNCLNFMFIILVR